MSDPQKLDDQLLEALTHLYDPDYVPPVALLDLMGCAPQEGATPLQSALIQAIDTLKPQEHLPTDAHLRRVYEVIRNRFVLKLTQDATAERMGLSARHLNRVQREAVHTLAQQLWEQQRVRSESEEKTPVPAGESDLPAEGLQASDWHAQTQREFASLRDNSPESTSDVAEIIRSVLALQDILWTTRGIEANIAHAQAGLVAAVHPAALRQMLIAALGRLSRFQLKEPITLFAGLEDGNVRITISTALATGPAPADHELVGEIMTPEGVSVAALVDGCNVFLTIRTPSAHQEIAVMVIDDNADMVRFYRRATVGTRYHIIHVEDEDTLMESVRSTPPNIIVTDVMLPHQDGWQLLMQLHQDPIARTIPVIVCSVVREKELALSLGAAHYIAKPVRPQEFIQALDLVLRRESTTASTNRKTTPAPC